MAVLQKLGWDKDLTPDELEVITRVASSPDKIGAVSWSTDLSGGIQRVALKHGCAPYGNGKARMVAWNLPDPIPVHREPIYTCKGGPRGSKASPPALSEGIETLKHAYPRVAATGCLRCSVEIRCPRLLRSWAE